MGCPKIHPVFHMASFWEIFTPGVLKYNVDMGLTLPDSGSGPPIGRRGWVRQGGGSSNTRNCNLWTTTTGTGTAAALIFPISNPPISAIDLSSQNCNVPLPVWCVSDIP
jgi:hypothetical protein